MKLEQLFALARDGEFVHDAIRVRVRGSYKVRKLLQWLRDHQHRHGLPDGIELELRLPKNSQDVDKTVFLHSPQKPGYKQRISIIEYTINLEEYRAEYAFIYNDLTPNFIVHGDVHASPKKNWKQAAILFYLMKAYPKAMNSRELAEKVFPAGDKHGPSLIRQGIAEIREEFPIELIPRQDSPGYQMSQDTAWLLITRGGV